MLTTNIERRSFEMKPKSWDFLDICHGCT